MLQSNNSYKNGNNASEQAMFQRVSINLPGRLMSAAREEYDCVVRQMSPGDAYIETVAPVQKNERIVAYIEQLGRIEGTIDSVDAHGLTVNLIASDRKKQKYSAQLTWFANRHELALAEDRRHERLAPKKKAAVFTLPDGQVSNCRIMDISLSGAAVTSASQPPVGTAIILENIRGRIVRHIEGGFAVEFSVILPEDRVSEFT